MSTPSKYHQDQLPRIKKNIRDSYTYFRRNREYFNNMRNFVFNTTISNDERAALRKLERPELEFNVVEAFISRLLGEFSKQVPGVAVHPDPTVTIAPQETMDFIEGHMRHIITSLRSNEIYKDQLSGGFSAMKVYTEYENEKSFKQKICLDRVFDPLLCGWDPGAQKSHKGDGSYCFEIIPVTEPQFRALFGEDIVLDGCYKGSLEGFKWGFKTNRGNYIMLCNYYEKKSKRVNLYELPNGTTLTESEYKEMIEMYVNNNDIEQPPNPVQKRWTQIPEVYRYQLISNKILECVKTDFCGLPIIFVDGNSTMIRKGGDSTELEQVTRSYVHNAIGTQKLKNLAGQTLANHIENMVQQKFKIASESIPLGQEEAYTHPQIASNLIYDQYGEDKTIQYNPPQEVVQTPLPGEVLNAYMSAEQTIQAALGSYDAALGINKNQLSGVALVEGATQSNAAAMPFVISNLAGLQQASEIILDLIPKYLITPRSVPVLTKEDKREHISINNPDGRGVQIKYNPGDLKIIVSAGVNFEVQKTRSLQMLIELSSSLPGMASLINNPKGLAIVSDNLSIKGADQIKAMAEQEVQQMEEQKSKMQNQPPPPPPEVQKIMLDEQKMIAKNKAETTALSIRAHEAQTSRIAALSKASDSQMRIALQAQKDNTERLVHGIKLGISNKSTDAKISKDMIDSATNLIGATPADALSAPIVPTQQAQQVQQNNQTLPEGQIIP